MSRFERLVLLWWCGVTALAAVVHFPGVSSWLAAQNATVQGAVYAATIAIVGVVINNLVSAWNTGRQLQHDREKQEAQLRMDLRRDIYLGLAETIGDGFNAIMWWADPGQEHAEIVKARRQAGKFAAQVHLMGSPSLVEATLRCESVVDDAAVRVRIRRDEYMRQRSSMLELRKRIDALRATRDAAVDALKAHVMSGTLTPADAQRLQTLVQNQEAAAAPLATQHNHILGRLPRMRWELWNYARGQQRECLPALISLVEAARAELDERIDMSVYATAGRQLEPDPTADNDLQRLFGVAPSAAPTSGSAERS